MNSSAAAIHSYRAKLDRAKQHLRELQQRIQNDARARRFGPIPKRDTDQARQQIAYVVPDDLRVTYGLVAGDTIQNLRAVLDHLIYALAGKKGGRHSQFPIFSDVRQYADQGLPMIVGLPTDAQTIIEGLQPYHAGRKPGAEPLAILASLSNMDKHRLIAVTEFQLAGDRFVSADWPADDFSGIQEGYITSGPLKDQTPIRTVPSGMKVQYQFAISITFGQPTGAAQGQRVVPLLTNLSDTVERIAELLEPFLGQ